MSENLQKIYVNTLEETDKLAERFAKIFAESGGLICLYGDIGTGKTTFIKYMAKHLDIKEKVTSPSFVILNEYHSGKLSLYHFDLYRLEREGLESVLDELHNYTEKEKALTVIEWAEFSLGDLPPERLEVRIKYIAETEREFSVIAFGEKYREITEKFKNKI